MNKSTDTAITKTADNVNLLKVIVSSFLLTTILYGLLPVFVYNDFSEWLTIWLSMIAINLVIQPFLFGISAYYIFKKKTPIDLLSAILLLVSLLLYLLPIILFCLIVFEDTAPQQF